jgi:predicted nucleic acid-binding protein
MPPYVDSGILIKLYVKERNSGKAIAALSQYSSLALNHLQELEVRNTLRSLEGRGLISPAQRVASEHFLEADLIGQRLRRTPVDWNAIYSEAKNLSHLYTAETLARSLDILHVAAALVSGVKEFITGDRRQQAMAERSGLTVTLIE